MRQKLKKREEGMANLEKTEYQLSGKKETERLTALDAIRGLAVIGMYVQHFALNARNGNLVSGNTMILFMLCSGISYSLMEKSAEEKGVGKKTLRTRILARSFLINIVGYFLILLNGPFGIVLPAYGMLFIMMVILLGTSGKKLIKISALLYFISPPLMVIGLSLFSGAPLLADFAGGPLSALAWSPVFVLGMVIGKMNLRDKRIPVKFITIGLAIMVPVKMFVITILPGMRAAVETWMLQFVPAAQIDEYAPWPLNTQPVQWQMLFVEMPQGGSTFELLVGTGLSLIVIGLLLWIGEKKEAALAPFAAVGRVSLTMYSLQFIFAWIAGLAGVSIGGMGSLPLGDILIMALVLVIGGALSKLAHPPLESLLRKFEKLFAA